MCLNHAGISPMLAASGWYQHGTGTLWHVYRGKAHQWDNNMIFELWHKHYTWHTFWSCLIRCANMKWIRWVLLKIQSGHDSVHRQTDGQTDKVKPVYPPFNFVEAGGIIIKISQITGTNTVCSTALQANNNECIKALPYLALCEGNPLVTGMDSPHKGPAMQKGFPRHHDKFVHCEVTTDSKCLGAHHLF